jgi:hypothetical protein
MNEINPTILADYVTLAEAAAQPNMPSVRTRQRMVQRRELPITYLGRTPLLHVPTFREVLRSREIKPVTERRGRR